VHIEQRRAELCFFRFGGGVERCLGQRNANLLRNRADGLLLPPDTLADLARIARAAGLEGKLPFAPGAAKSL